MLPKFVRILLDHLPYVGGLRLDHRELQAKVRQQAAEILKCRIAIGEFPLGHYHSPIPSGKDVEAHIASLLQEPELRDIDLNLVEQQTLLSHLSSFYQEIPFKDKKAKDVRYFFENPYFEYGDAIFLYSIMRNIRPRRVIEVGSGFSSAVMLDTANYFLNPQPEFTFIEPNPARLQELLACGDDKKVTLIRERLQEVPLEVFDELAINDLLFIDSSHVVKCGSDLLHLFYRILPRIKPGVVVHFHDVIWPFDYPVNWHNTHRYWNEAYFLRVFLAHNDAWKIYWWNSLAGQALMPLIQKQMPLCLKNLGGSIYLQRK
jgi:predicted O-methyltransferase YrrM